MKMKLPFEIQFAAGLQNAHPETKGQVIYCRELDSLFTARKAKIEKQASKDEKTGKMVPPVYEQGDNKQTFNSADPSRVWVFERKAGIDSEGKNVTSAS